MAAGAEGAAAGATTGEGAPEPRAESAELAERSEADERSEERGGERGERGEERTDERGGRRRRGGRGRREFADGDAQGQLDIGATGAPATAGDEPSAADAGAAVAAPPSTPLYAPQTPAMPSSEPSFAAAPVQTELATPSSQRPQPPQAAQPIEPYTLPAADLQSLASAAGLEWVGSDAGKVAAAQAAMAAEPKPVHVPREPKPQVVVDEGPLVLVETRKDLAQTRLPFESAS